MTGGNITVLPMITVDEGIKLKRINPIYAVDLEETVRIHVSFPAGAAACEANYIELLENADQIVFEFYGARENPLKITTLSFFAIREIKISRPQAKTLLINVI